MFQQTPVIESRLIIGKRNSRNLTRELVHRRPQQKKHSIMNRILQNYKHLNSSKLNLTQKNSIPFLKYDVHHFKIFSFQK
jgi:hypothetical protein